MAYRRSIISRAIIYSFVLFLCVLCHTQTSYANFRVTADVENIYNHILKGHLETSRRLILDSDKMNHPNGMHLLLENYADILELLIIDSLSTFENNRNRKNLRLKQLKAISDDSPYHAYIEAEILLQWSVLEYKYDYRWQAMKNVWAAHNILTKNRATHPNFLPNYRSLGLLHCFMGTLPIPNGLRWMLEKTSGITADIDVGMAEIEYVLQKAPADYLFYDETKVLYAYMHVHMLNREEKAWTLINQLSDKHENKPLILFAKANMALRTGRLQLCIEACQQIFDQTSDKPLAYAHLLAGKAHLFLGNEEAAEQFRFFLVQHKGESYQLAARQKLAWHYLLAGDSNAYSEQIAFCLGKAEQIVGEDKSAFIEASTGIVPDTLLLRGRLLFDGRQFQRGINVLKSNHHLVSNAQKALEYHYRLGRLYQGILENEKAIYELSEAYYLGKNERSYFACNAALQIALIYEQTKHFDAAKNWFNYCLKLNPDSYQRALHHKAKTGLKRIKKQ